MQDKNIDFCGILNLLSALKKSGISQGRAGAGRCAHRGADRRNDPYFFLNFFAKSSSFNEMTVVCCVATRRR